MDLDKIIAIIRTLGFPAAIAVWFLWKIQAYMDAMTVSQVQITELLRQLIAMHK